MNLVTDSFSDSIRLDFQMACLELARAERAERARSTPATQAWVQQCRDRVDAILDMWNESEGVGT